MSRAKQSCSPPGLEIMWYEVLCEEQNSRASVEISHLGTKLVFDRDWAVICSLSNVTVG